MGKCYVELRKSSGRENDSIAADLMRHLHTRQYLGKTVIVCEHPFGMLSIVRKQWLKLSRTIQRRRASTLNADKILKYTHTITHMQHLQFTTKTPLEHPEADVYLLSPEKLQIMPIQCWNVYITTTLTPESAQTILGQLPTEALLVDYDHSLPWQELGVQSKKILEEQVANEWKLVRRFLETYNIRISTLNTDGMRNVEAMDDALDTLLGVGRKFLQTANEFQRTIELARPFRIGRKLHEEYDSFILLAHRVQALTPGAFTQHFLETYDEDDTFYMYDAGKKQSVWSADAWAAMVSSHIRAGRHNLALALRTII